VPAKAQLLGLGPKPDPPPVVIPTLQAPKNLSEPEQKLYDLVVKRFLSVFFPAAEYRVTTRITEVVGHHFKTEGKVLVEPGGARSSAPPARRSSPNGSARSRAEQDPIVQRMKEKFGAEIRTVIDYREKG